MQTRSLVVSLLTAASLVAAQFRVTVPSTSNWWVARSTNILEWTCREANAPAQFTVLIGNSDQTILVQPLAIIAQQNNFDCSIIITQDQANQAAGQGYQVYLANPLNNTDVYATSEPFEIKPLGSLYPTQQAAAASSAAAAASASAAANSTNSNNNNNNSGAFSVRSGVIGGMAAGVVGLVGGIAATML
ncbi:hypothetical protein H1R20_g14464, partial [Candolleomyces eurysporus]